MALAVALQPRACAACTRRRSRSRCISPAACRSFTIVGLPEAEVKEARDRVRAALQNARFDFPARQHHRQSRARGPAEGIRAASTCRSRSASSPRPGSFRADALERFEFAGELALGGDLRPVRGALAMSLGAQRRRPRVRAAARERARSGARRGRDRLRGARPARGLRALRGPRALARYADAAAGRRAPAIPTSPTCKGRRTRSARSKSPPPAGTAAHGRPARHRQDDARARACRASCRR